MTFLTLASILFLISQSPAETGWSSLWYAAACSGYRSVDEANSGYVTVCEAICRAASMASAYSQVKIPVELTSCSRCIRDERVHPQDIGRIIIRKVG